MSTATPEREQAAKIRQGLTERVEAIRAQVNLTQEGRDAHMAKAVVTARAKLAELQQAEMKRITDAE
jgi:hypothetical protein